MAFRTPQLLSELVNTPSGSISVQHHVIGVSLVTASRPPTTYPKSTYLGRCQV